MLIMFVSPTLPRKLETNSSKRSWPTSMQSVCLIVLTRIFLSVSLAATSIGGNGLAIRLSVALLEGTLRCSSTFAAAEEEMGLAGLAVGSGGSVGMQPRPATIAGSGITMDSPQDGQLISVPAPELSTANSCSHLG